jgi:crotonobetainyl-CoA:carnitine CoA-transferase CaiB-like acyl-CoA transferase
MGSRLGWAVYRLFTTRDERQVFIAITSNAHWERFCKEFDLPDLWEDQSLNTNAKRAAQRDRIIPRIQAIAGQHTSAELVERLERIRVPYAPLNNPLDLLEDQHLNEGGRFLEVHGADGQTVRVPALPVAGDGLQAGIRHHPPALGQHSAEILAELGYPADTIADFVERRVIVDGGPTLFMTGPAE